MSDPATSALLTDLYQLTMMQTYHAQGMSAPAVFEFFVRRLPESRNFLVAAGLDQVLEFLEGVRFTDDELDYLARDGRFRAEFLEYLRSFRFSGDVQAMPEGTVCFADEPLLRVTAPIAEAQLVESRIINLLQFQTLIASKAARCVLVAGGRTLVDFGMRRAHGAEAALLAARGTYLAGFDATSNVLAGMRYGIPTSGTMAHSLIQAHERESQAFRQFALANPGNVTLLIDTYDTEAGAVKAIELAAQLGVRGIAVQAVRLDSGDLAEHARRVRAMLDGAGLASVKIFASGNLDEYQVRELLAKGAPIDAFGIGTRLDVSADVPYLDCAYKLQEYAGIARRKRSEGKTTWPGRKQVFRRLEQGRLQCDTLALEQESAEGEPLLKPVMQAGGRIEAPESLQTIRQRVERELAQLPATLQGLERAQPYPVVVSPAIHALAGEIDRRLSQAQGEQEVRP